MALDYSRLGLENNNLLARFLFFFSSSEKWETMYKTILQRNYLFIFLQLLVSALV